MLQKNKDDYMELCREKDYVFHRLMFMLNDLRSDTSAIFKVYEYTKLIYNNK